MYKINMPLKVIDLILLIVLTAGCTPGIHKLKASHVKYNKIRSKHIHIGEKLPRIAILIPKEERQKTYTVSYLSTDWKKIEGKTKYLYKTDILDIGDYLVKASKAVFSEFIKEPIYVVENMSSSGAYAFLKPTIESYEFSYWRESAGLNYCLSGPNLSQSYGLRHTGNAIIKLTLYDTQGGELWSDVTDVQTSQIRKYRNPREAELIVYGLEKMAKGMYASNKVHAYFESMNKKKEKKEVLAVQSSPQPPKLAKLDSKTGIYWAVIIGISEYNDTRIPSLRYASNDAQAFYKWTVSPNGGRYAPTNVKLLLDKEANYKNIKNALFVWLKQALEEDIVIIYFAVHGSPESPESPDNLFLFPYDTEYNNIATTGFPMC